MMIIRGRILAVCRTAKSPHPERYLADDARAAQIRAQVRSNFSAGRHIQDQRRNKQRGGNYVILHVTSPSPKEAVTSLQPEY